MVVGIGGSAGGLKALMALLETLDADAPLTIVVVLHLAPDHESHAVEILQRTTRLIVTQVRSRTRLAAGHIGHLGHSGVRWIDHLGSAVAAPAPIAAAVPRHPDRVQRRLRFHRHRVAAL